MPASAPGALLDVPPAHEGEGRQEQAAPTDDSNPQLLGVCGGSPRGGGRLGHSRIQLRCQPEPLPGTLVHRSLSVSPVPAFLPRTLSFLNTLRPDGLHFLGGFANMNCASSPVPGPPKVIRGVTDPRIGKLILVIVLQRCHEERKISNGLKEGN